MTYGYPQSLIGKRDRQVWLVRSNLTYNELNEPVETFVRVRAMWAEVKHISAAETYDSNSTRAVKTAKFRVMYCTDINETDRIEHDNQMYKVLGITELGRRDLTEIFAEMVEGMAP